MRNSLHFARVLKVYFLTSYQRENEENTRCRKIKKGALRLPFISELIDQNA